MPKTDNQKGKTVDELKKLLGEKRVALESFRFNISGSKVKNVKEARNTRRDAARILTELKSQADKK